MSGSTGVSQRAASRMAYNGTYATVQRFETGSAPSAHMGVMTVGRHRRRLHSCRTASPGPLVERQPSISDRGEVGLGQTDIVVLGSPTDCDELERASQFRYRRVQPTQPAQFTVAVVGNAREVEVLLDRGSFEHLVIWDRAARPAHELAVKALDAGALAYVASPAPTTVIAQLDALRRRSEWG